MQPVSEIDEPIDILTACHARFRSLSALFRKMTRHHGQPDGAYKMRQAAAHVRQFMEGPARYHLMDEVDLLDLLVAASPRMMRFETESLVRRMHVGHQQIQRQWQWLRPMINAIEAGEPVCPDAQLFNRFMATIETHLGHAESVCYPLMQRLLHRQQLLDLGMKMSLRRGARYLDN